MFDATHAEVRRWFSRRSGRRAPHRPSRRIVRSRRLSGVAARDRSDRARGLSSRRSSRSTSRWTHVAGRRYDRLRRPARNRRTVHRSRRRRPVDGTVRVEDIEYDDMPQLARQLKVEAVTTHAGQRACPTLPGDRRSPATPRTADAIAAFIESDPGVPVRLPVAGGHSADGIGRNCRRRARIWLNHWPSLFAR